MLLALSLAFALAFFFFLVMLIFLARRSSGEEVKRRLDVFRDVEPVREEEENPDDLKRIPLYQRTIGRAFTGIHGHGRFLCPVCAFFHSETDGTPHHGGRKTGHMEGTAGGGTLVPEHGPFRDSCLLLHHQDPRVHGTGALYHLGRPPFWGDASLWCF